MEFKSPRRFNRPVLIWSGLAASAAVSVAAASFAFAQASPTAPVAAEPPQPAGQPAATSGAARDRATTNLPWRLNNPAPHLVLENRANPVAIADKFASRARSMEQRASLRAFEGAPPVIPHAIADLNVQTCRVCHAEGLKAGDKTAKMTSHTYLTNCTQCHVEAAETALGSGGAPLNSFVGFRSSGYGGTRAWAGAPPAVPHTTFMRTNCVSCHGEHGYDGWRPDHLSRTNCAQCHLPAAEFDQLAPTFGVPDVADGQAPTSKP